MNDLPKGWEHMALGEICLPTTRRNPRKEGDGEFSYVDISAIDNERNVVSDPKRLTRKDAPGRAIKDIRAGDVVFALVRPYLRNTARIPAGLNGQVASSGFAVLRAGELVDPDFLFYAVTRPEFIATLPTRGHHSPSAREDELLSMKIPIPPLDEQKSIVEEIEKQFTRLDAAATSLRSAHVKARALKTAVLDSAVQQATGPGTESATLPELSETADYGTSVKCDYGLEGPPVVRIPNIVGRETDLTDLKRAPAASKGRLPSPLQRGDFLVVRTNGSRDLIGRGALVRADFDEPTHHASYLIRFRLPADETLGRWLAIAWHAPATRRQIIAASATSAGQYNVSLRSLGSVSFPVPPAHTRDAICDEVEERLTTIGAVAADVAAGERRTIALRRAVLTSAFSGQLLAEVPDER